MKLSVCIQTYNHAPYIAQALDSVLMQETDFDFEILLGEDESTDGTREICQEYARKHPDKIRLFLNSRENVIYINGRPTGRWNFMNNLRHVRGEYVALLDGDDYWTDPRKLQKQVDVLDASPELVGCAHPAAMLDEATGAFRNWPRAFQGRVSTDDLILGNCIPTCSVMYRWSVIDELPDWFQQMPVADWPLHVLHSLHGDFGFLAEEMGCYRVHHMGAWNSLHSEERESSMVAMLEAFERLLPSQLKAAVRSELVRRYASLARIQISADRLSAGARSIARALSHSGLSWPRREVVRAGLQLAKRSLNSCRRVSLNVQDKRKSYAPCHGADCASETAQRL